MVLAVTVNVSAFFQKKQHHDLTFLQKSFDRGGKKKHQRYLWQEIFTPSVKFFKADPRTKFDCVAANKRPFHTCHNVPVSQTVPKEDSKLAQAQPLTPEDRAANAKKQPQSEDSPSSPLDKFSFDNRPQRQSSDESNELNNQDTLRIGDQVTKLRKIVGSTMVSVLAFGSSCPGFDSQRSWKIFGGKICCCCCDYSTVLLRAKQTVACKCWVNPSSTG